MKHTSVTLENRTVKKIESIQRSEGRSFSNVIGRLVNEALAVREKAQEKHEAESA